MADFSKLYSLVTRGYEKISSTLPRGYALWPNHVYILVADMCNLRCAMCTWVKGRNGKRGEREQLSRTEISRIFHTLPGKPLITLSGGEPLMRKDIFHILSEGRKKFKLHLITNGTLLTKGVAEEIVDLSIDSICSGGVLMVGISLHGDKKIEDEISGKAGTYEKILEGIRALTEARRRAKRRYPLIHLTTVITPENLHMLSRMYLLSQKLGVDYHNFTLQSNSEKIHSFDGLDGSGLYETPPSHGHIDGEALRKELENIGRMRSGTEVVVRFSPLNITPDEILGYYQNRLDLSSYNCSGLWSKMVISPYGDVYMCYRKLGNTRSDKVMRIWNSNPYRDLRKEIKSARLKAGCAGCCFRSFSPQ